MTTETKQDAPPGSYHNPGPAFNVPITIKVSAHTLASIIITAIESGIHGIYGWSPKQRLRHPADDGFEGEPQDTVVTEKDEHEVWNEFIARNVALGGTLTIFEDADDRRIERTYVPHTLTREKLLMGLGRYIAEGHASGPFEQQEDGTVDFDIDGPAADVIFQYALLGSQVYG